MLGEDTKDKSQQFAERSELDDENAFDTTALSHTGHDVNDATSSPNTAEQEVQSTKLTGRQKARKKRAEKFHLEKERELSIKRAKNRRVSHKNTMTKTTSSGQPRLGSQMGVLLDKIKKQES